MPIRNLFIVLVCATSLGCSVDGVDGLFGSDDGDGPSDGGRGQGGAPTQTTTGNPDGGSNPDTTTDTGGPATTTDATTTGPDPGGPTVYCNEVKCEDGQICCYYQFNIGKDFCSESGGCPDFEGWVELQCNGPDDCPGQTCCGHWNRKDGWTGSACASSCNGGDNYELCSNPAGQPDLTACEIGSVCKASESLGTGYSFCDDTL